MRGPRESSLSRLLARSPWLAAAQIRSAVNDVLAVAPTGISSVQDLIQAWGLHRGKPITIENEILPAGVFGQWLSFSDRDVLRIRPGELSRERTIAHELGHMALGHRGLPVADYLASQMQAASTDLVAHMLQRSCDENHAWPREEVAAERFASLLLRRLSDTAAHTKTYSQQRINDALN